MIGLDTNILVRFFMQDDPAQARAASTLLEETLSEQESGFISVGTLLETVWVLKARYAVPKEEILLVLDHLLRTRNLALQHRREVAKAYASWRIGQGSFSDLLIGELNAAAGCTTTYTFDRGAPRVPGFSLLPETPA